MFVFQSFDFGQNPVTLILIANTFCKLSKYVNKRLTIHDFKGAYKGVYYVTNV